MFHLCKATRIYTGTPYAGPTSGGKSAETTGYDDACRMACAFNERNPVGWDVYEASTGKLVFSTCK